MAVEIFFEKFELFAGAPNAVAKVRELVLELAIRGKLVARDASDVPSRELLESAKAERAKLIAARKIKAREVLPVKPVEQPFELPSGWAWARLAEVSHELGQKIPDKRFSYIDVGSIDSFKGRISDRVEELEPEEAPSRARKLVVRGTVIYSTVRPYLLNVAIVENAYDPEPIASTAFGILQPFAGIYNRYLFYWLRSAPFTAYVQEGMKGMAYPAINDEKLYNGLVALPPLAEQKRIVAKVDELMALCDRLEAQQKEREMQHAALARASLARFAEAPSPGNLNFIFHKSYNIAPADLRKSILNLAIRGKLASQDPTDEPVADLCTPPGSGQRTQPIADKEIPFSVPNSWKWIRLGSVSELINGDRGKNYPDKAEYVPSGVPFINTGHINQDGTLSIKWMNYLARAKFDSLRSGKVRKGDLVYCLRGATLGKAAIISQFDEGAIASSLVIIRPNEKLMPRYAYFFLISPLGRELIKRFDNGSAQPNLSANSVKRYVTPLPPLSEQRRIVAKVDQLMILVDMLEAQLATACDTAMKLLDALVAELTARARG